MVNPNDNEKELELLKSLYPELTPDQLLEVKERLDGYFEVALQIFLRQEEERRGRAKKQKES